MTNSNGDRFAGLFWLHFAGVLESELAIDRQLTLLLAKATCSLNCYLNEVEYQALIAWWSQVNRLLVSWEQKPVIPVDGKDLLNCIRQLSRMIFFS